MSLSKDDLLKRREELAADYDTAVAEIEKGEAQIKSMRNNLNAMAGALQQTELFIKQIEDDGDPMPEDKKFALDMATSQEKSMNTRIIEEKEESNGMIHETLTTNPRDAAVEVETPDESTEQEKKENEKL